ncbi:MAG: PQQ-dependent sugar dehydrogenase [Pseudomonadota bacterium]
MFRKTLPLVAAAVLAGCGAPSEQPASATYGADVRLAAPRKPGPIPTLNPARAVGWPAGARPTPPAGFAVTAFAAGLDHPRWLYRLPNGDVLVAESNSPPRRKTGLTDVIAAAMMTRAGAGVPSADRITLLRDADGDGVAETRAVYLEGLNSPFGMAVVGDWFYVANTDAIWRWPFRPGDTKIAGPGEKVVDLPAAPPNNHWARNIIALPDGKALFVTVGSNSNIAEGGMAAEAMRAAILRLDLETRTLRVFAGGLRNPNGLAYEPATGALWTTVNERDMLGHDLVPDYMTAVKAGAHYGWPWSYFGGIVDERVEPRRPDMVARAVRPDYALGAHTASLGLAFVPACEAAGCGPASTLSARFGGGALIGQHGSWNRDPPSGYKVVFVPFEQGRPAGAPRDFLTGFLNARGEAMGRPVGVILDARQGVLVADDVGNVIWRVAAK